jgi:hypothetical protein
LQKESRDEYGLDCWHVSCGEAVQAQIIASKAHYKVPGCVGRLSQDTLLAAADSATMALGGMFVSKVAMAKAGSSGLALGLR